MNIQVKENNKIIYTQTVKDLNYSNMDQTNDHKMIQYSKTISLHSLLNN